MICVESFIKFGESLKSIVPSGVPESHSPTSKICPFIGQKGWFRWLCLYSSPVWQCIGYPHKKAVSGPQSATPRTLRRESASSIVSSTSTPPDSSKACTNTR
ncbi:hypothetical protein PoB_000069000 [Plakobranchus ocellatus]|uniref:Uncharacterized protein n=1 Tax=Plakobranchus ocellatus TaxID=259542 RepID=A0AAV3XUX4_9GAST|nr:hypothetical protein PoB_000069000 [Plakobranchus ocellatus]